MIVALAQLVLLLGQASDAAARFDLNLGALPTDETVTAPAPALSADAPIEPASGAVFTLDTPIVVLIADPRARAILDRDLPGISTDENLAKFEGLGLRRFQPLTGGQMTDALLAKVQADLAAILPLAPGKGRNAGR